MSSRRILSTLVRAAPILEKVSVAVPVPKSVPFSHRSNRDRRVFALTARLRGSPRCNGCAQHAGPRSSAGDPDSAADAARARELVARQ